MSTSTRCVGCVRGRFLFAMPCMVVALLAAVATRCELTAQENRTFANPDYTTAATLYSGRYEARIGTSYEPSQERLRLDIGGTHNLIYHRMVDQKAEGTAMIEEWKGTMSFGADFFTWTRLRATSSFKFPVEAVDYYFGLNAAGRFNTSFPINEVRCRVAHISAHLVDGDTGLVNGSRPVTTYSREFVDLVASHIEFNDGLSALRLYVGGEWLFHSIPDTMARVTPFVGGDVQYAPSRGDVTLRGGLELRLNPDYEHSIELRSRLGLKFNRLDATGLLLEAGYNLGRSAYGQYYDRTEEFGWIGFGIDFSAPWLTTK